MRLRTLLALLVLAALAASCSGDDAEDTTTTASGGAGAATTLPGVTSPGGTSGEGIGDTTTSSTVDLGEPVTPEFSIVTREPGDDGDTVVVLLDDETYESLTDIDLQNVISEVVDDFPPVYEAHVVESQAAADAVLAEEPTPEQQQTLDNDYLARLEEGFRIVFLGPFAESGAVILGS